MTCMHGCNILNILLTHNYFFSVWIQLPLTIYTTNQNLLYFMRCFWSCSCSSALTAKLKIHKSPCDKMAPWWQWSSSVANAKALFGTHKVTCLMASILRGICCWVYLYWWLGPLLVRFCCYFVTLDCAATRHVPSSHTRDHSFSLLSSATGSCTELASLISSRTWKMWYGQEMGDSTPWDTRPSMELTQCSLQA